MYNTEEMTERRREEIVSLCQRFGLPGRRPAILSQALTHRSFAFENPPAEDNERLEFLGDSILGLVASDYFYQRYPEADEGDLSKKKARVVSRALLGKAALEMELGRYMRLGHGEEQTGGRRRASLLGSALEALIGAVYLSDGFESTNAFVRGHVLESLLRLLQREEDWDYKSRLQEYAQKALQTTPRYETLSITGPDHDRIYTVRVILMGRAYPEQTAPKKKFAENQAARAAMEAIAQEAAAGENVKNGESEKDANCVNEAQQILEANAQEIRDEIREELSEPRMDTNERESADEPGALSESEPLNDSEPSSEPESTNEVRNDK